VLELLIQKPVREFLVLSHKVPYEQHHTADPVAGRVHE
jgi:hypothetical protein